MKKKYFLFIFLFAQTNLFAQTTTWNSLGNSGSKTIILYGSDFGMKADGISDDTPAFNLLMAACKSLKTKGVLPSGTIRLASKPNDIDFFFDLSGMGNGLTGIIRDYSEAHDSVGCINLVSGSSTSHIHDFSLSSGAGTTGGSLIAATPSASISLGYIVLENMSLSTYGTNTHQHTIYFDGSKKVGAPTGVRDIFLKNVSVFGSNLESAFFKSVVGLVWIGSGCYSAGGASPYTGEVSVTGTASVPSQYININIVTCYGLSLSNCLNVNIVSPSMYGGIGNSNTADQVIISSNPTGTVMNNWTNSGIIRPGTGWATH